MANSQPLSRTLGQKQNQGPGELARLAVELDAAVAVLEESRSEAAAPSRAGASWWLGCSTTCAHLLRGSVRMVEALEDGVVDDPAKSTVFTGRSGWRSTASPPCRRSLRALEDPRRGRAPAACSCRTDEALSDIVAGATLLAWCKGVESEASLADSPVVRLRPGDGKGRAEPRRQRDQAHGGRGHDPDRGGF